MKPKIEICALPQQESVWLRQHDETTIVISGHSDDPNSPVLIFVDVENVERLALALYRMRDQMSVRLKIERSLEKEKSNKASQSQ